MTSPDSPEQLKSDLAADPDVRAAMQAELDDYAEQFLRGAVRLARQVQLMDDIWTAKRVIETLLWSVAEANKQVAKDVLVKGKPKNTAGAFDR